VVLSAFFGTEILDCEAFRIGFESEDVDTDGGILFFEEGDLFGFHRIIDSGHVECGFVTGIICETLFVDFRWVQGRQHRPQKTFQIVKVFNIDDTTFRSEECRSRNVCRAVQGTISKYGYDKTLNIF